MLSKLALRLLQHTLRHLTPQLLEAETEKGYTQAKEKLAAPLKHYARCLRCGRPLTAYAGR